MWSDHGMNFVGVARQIKELYDFLRNQDFRACVGFLYYPNGNYPRESTTLWWTVGSNRQESLKKHLSRIVGTVKLRINDHCANPN